jgi:hypothetical protein
LRHANPRRNHCGGYFNLGRASLNRDVVGAIKLATKGAPGIRAIDEAGAINKTVDSLLHSIGELCSIRHVGHCARRSPATPLLRPSTVPFWLARVRS